MRAGGSWKGTERVQTLVLIRLRASLKPVRGEVRAPWLRRNIMNVDDCINLDDLRVLAKKRVPKLIYDFIEGGSEDESGLVRNEDAFRQRALGWRVHDTCM